MAITDRRTLIKLLSATAASSLAPVVRAGKPLRVVVAGAGIIGASIAYHLARDGADVTVIDRQAPASHASRGTFAWINATWAKQPRHYHTFSQASVAYWHDLQRELALPVRWGGSLEWFDAAARQERLAVQIAEQADWGEPARMVSTAEFQELEPRVRFPSNWQAAYSPNDGAVDPVIATELLLAAARRIGARLHYPCRLDDVALQHGRLKGVVTCSGTIPADRLVLATGAAPDVILPIAGIDVPQRSRPGIIAITAPLPRILQRIVAAPGIHMHQRDDGRVVIGEQAGAPQTDAHAARLAQRPNSFPATQIAAEHAERMLSIAQDFAPDLQDAPIDHVYIGWRPLPIDGHPVIGPSPVRSDVYLTIMHSGVTLAAITGRRVASELLAGRPEAQLAPYRADRDFELIKRY